MLHDAIPPKATLNRLLIATPNGSTDYGHLLLEQAVAAITDGDVEDLLPYFESAHLDAREVFHHEASISLHPEAGARGAHATYPACLPDKAIRGLFGEVMCGLISEAYTLVGSRKWRVPIFLFREHAAVGRYIFELAFDPSRVKEVHGRFGNDFIGLELDADGELVSFIAGEAKWRKDLTQSAMDTIMLGDGKGRGAARVWENNGVWSEVNSGLPTPHGLFQLSRLLALKDRDRYSRTIASLEAALFGGPPIPRVDFILVAGNRATKRLAGHTLLPKSSAPSEYTAGRPLQIVEIVLDNGEQLIDRIYKSMWARHG